jgi:oligopeptidase B
MKTPQAKKYSHIIEQHGTKRDDPYAWLRDKNWQNITQGDINFKNPEILSYIEEENEYTKKNLENLHLEQKKQLYQEILSRIKEDYESYPMKKGEYLYYHRMSKGKDYPILCRKKQNEIKETIYFDVNKEALGHDVFFLRGHETNDDESLMAYMVNVTGSMECTLKIRDIHTGVDLEINRDGLNGSFEWISKDQLVYVKRDQTSRGKYLYLLDLNSPDEDRLIFEKDSDFDHMFMGIDRSSDKGHLNISLESGGSCAIYSSSLEEFEFKQIAYGDNDISYDFDHFKDNSYLLTNKNAPKFKLLTKKDGQDNWEEFIPEKEDFYLEDFHLYDHYLLLDQRNLNSGISELDIIDLEDPSHTNKVNFKEDAYTFQVVGSYNAYDSKIRISYESPITPEQELELNLNDGSLSTLKQYEIPNYDSSKYVIKREFAKARDGALIPVTLIHQKGLKSDGLAPAYVYAYGSYGMGLEPDFSASIFSLIERGFCAVTAHIRGGDDLGHEWYLNGKLLNKKNTFHDYIDVCEHLINEGYTSKGQIVGHGGSAGGLLTGVVSNLRPDLFKALVCEVPFVDLINTISDPSLPLTPPEWEEWGNPIESETDFNYMLSYSPYDQIKKQEYPSLFYISGISDEQVTYWEPLKMVAKLREYNTSKSPIYLKIKMGAGHAGASKRYEWIEDLALIFHFILESFNSQRK